VRTNALNYQGWAGPLTDRPVPLPRLAVDHLSDDLPDHLDFYFKDHDYRRQEGEMVHYLIPPLVSRRADSRRLSLFGAKV